MIIRLKVKSQRKEADPEVIQIVDDLTLFDDTLMSKVFDKNIEATELLLSIILERDDITVISVKGQEDLRNPHPKGRNIKLDIHAVDGDAVEFDVEVQRNVKGSHNRRARFHGSMMDTRMLKEKQEFKELRDAYVIFICQHDKFKQNKPIYHVDKVVRETGETFDDGAHIIYVNGKYRGDDAFGKLAHDFNCKKSKNMYYKPLADGVRHFKETEKGREIMCESVQRYGEKRRIDTLVDNVKLLMKNMKCSLDDALNTLEVTGKERTIITKQLQK